MANQMFYLGEHEKVNNFVICELQTWFLLLKGIGGKKKITAVTSNALKVTSLK